MRSLTSAPRRNRSDGGAAVLFRRRPLPLDRKVAGTAGKGESIHMWDCDQEKRTGFFCFSLLPFFDG